MIKYLFKTHQLFPSLYPKSMSSFNSSRNLFHLLQLPITASEIQIKNRYYELAKRYHPDHNKGTEIEFIAINEAYQILSNPQLKNQYLKVIGASTIHQTERHGTKKSKINNDVRQKKNENKFQQRVYCRVSNLNGNYRFFKYDRKTVDRTEMSEKWNMMKEEEFQKKLYQQGRIRNGKIRWMELLSQALFFVFLISVLFGIPTIIKYSKERQMKSSYSLNMAARATYPYQKIKQSQKRKKGELSTFNGGDI